jgi:type III secretory pathway component EscT
MLSLAYAHGHAPRTAISWAGLAPAFLVELALGAAIGIAASALYDGAYSGGRAVDDYVGIRISVPTAGLVAGAGFGRLWSLGFTAAFFILGGHRVLLQALDHTFVTLPPGMAISGGLATIAPAVPGTLLRAALFVAGPALAFGFTAQVALAAIGRIVPRFGTFPLTFPVVLGCALLATMITLPIMLLQAGRPWLDLSPFGA